MLSHQQLPGFELHRAQGLSHATTALAVERQPRHPPHTIDRASQQSAGVTCGAGSTAHTARHTLNPRSEPTIPPPARLQHEGQDLTATTHSIRTITSTTTDLDPAHIAALITAPHLTLVVTSAAHTDKQSAKCRMLQPRTDPRVVDDRRLFQASRFYTATTVHKAIVKTRTRLVRVKLRRRWRRYGIQGW